MEKPSTLKVIELSRRTASGTSAAAAGTGAPETSSSRCCRRNETLQPGEALEARDDGLSSSHPVACFWFCSHSSLSRDGLCGLVFDEVPITISVFHRPLFFRSGFSIDC
ncbi:hypothetical protein NL676_008452 [Syzygium grande]|nr:hypothetical protein NL676_008452 [Syzygium grande]